MSALERTFTHEWDAVLRSEVRRRVEGLSGLGDKQREEVLRRAHDRLDAPEWLYQL